MHKYNAHGATDVTGFGLLGHAQNLAKHQKNEVSFVIHNLPVISKMAAVAKACGNMFQLLQGHSAETSGGLLICLPREQVNNFKSYHNCQVYKRNSLNAKNVLANKRSNFNIFSIHTLQIVDRFSCQYSRISYSREIF